MEVLAISKLYITVVYFINWTLKMNNRRKWLSRGVFVWVTKTGSTEWRGGLQSRVSTVAEIEFYKILIWAHMPLAVAVELFMRDDTWHRWLVSMSDVQWKGKTYFVFFVKWPKFCYSSFNVSVKTWGHFFNQLKKSQKQAFYCAWRRLVEVGLSSDWLNY